MSSVSSSWLRRKFAYWQSMETSIVSCRAAAIGPASWRASRLHQREVEQQLDLVGVLTAEEVDQLFGRQVHLTQEHPVSAPPGDEGAEMPQDPVGIEIDVGDLARVDQERDGVDPEPVDAQLEPEPGDLRDLVADLRVPDVEVRLVRVEVVEVELLGFVVPRPDAVLRVGEDDRGILRPRRPVPPDVEVAEPVVRRGPRLAEPGVSVGRVVDHQVDDDADPAVLRRPDERDEVTQRPEALIDGVVVRDVVPVVPVRRGLERHEPDAADADAGQVVDPFGQSPDVADPVPVPVEEGLDVQAVDGGVLPPEIARPGRRHEVSSGSVPERGPSQSTLRRRWSRTCAEASGTTNGVVDRVSPTWSL